MATVFNSSRYPTTNSNVQWFIQVEVYSQSVELLRSYVYVSVWVISTNGSNIPNSSTPGDAWIRVNDQDFIYNSVISQEVVASPSGTCVLNRGTFAVNHSSIGASATIKVEANITGSAWANQNSGSSRSYTFTIPGMAQKSTISSITGGTIGGNMTVNINKPTSSTTTSVWVKVGSLDWQNVIWKQGGTSFSFTVPNVLATQITSSTSATGTVKIRTYSGDTELGDDDWNKSFEVPTWMAPSISQVLLDTDTCVNEYWCWVKDKSKLRVTTSTNDGNLYGASIASYRIDFDGKVYWGSQIWTDYTRVSGTRSVVVTVTDSRGRTASWSGSINVWDYAPPWGSISAVRCDKNGNIDNKNGTYVKVQYSGDKYSINGKNTFALSITHRESDSTWSENDAWSGTPVSNGSIILGSETSSYDKDKTYEIKLKVSDWYGSTSYSVPISTVDVPLDYRAGGTGIGIGRYCLDDNTIQTIKEFKIYTGGGTGDSNKGADVKFCEVSNEKQMVGLCGGRTGGDTLMRLHRFTSSSSGEGDKDLLRITKSNDAYHNFRVNYFENGIRFYGDSTKNEGTISYNDSGTYVYLHNPKYSNSSIGVWSDAGCVWEYDAPSQTLRLKSGYGTTSDARLKHDFDEFEDWDKYYNFFMSLKPLTFKYINDNRRDTYMGMVAQDVVESIESSGLGDKNLCIAKYHENKEMDDGKEYTLAYQELIPLNIKMIQKHENDIQELKDKIELFKETAKKLKKE